MNLPKSEETPDDPERLPPARRRRARRLLAPLDSDERATSLESLARRTSPSFDFFLFSLLAGAGLGIGLLFDAPSLLLLGALLAPLMGPVVGISLGTIVGSAQFFLRSLIGLLIGSGLVFGISLLAGYAAQLLQLEEFSQAHLHAQLSWPGLVVLSIGALLTAVAMVRSTRHGSLSHYGGLLASVALAYELYVPLTAAGFGLVAGIPHLWPDGLVVFSVHLALAALLGAFSLALLGFRPLTLFGYTVGGAFTLLSVIFIIGITGMGAAFGTQVALPTPLPSLTPTPTTPPPTATITLTPVPPTETLTPTSTATLTLTPSPTVTPSPTPMFALINSSRESGGAHLRAEPGLSARIIRTYLNETSVQIFPETSIEADGMLWVSVIAPDGNHGWMLQALLLVPTPETTP
jgi:uncharacterized membrane protein